MESTYLPGLIIESVDNDLADLLRQGKLKGTEAIAVQQLRILRGRHIQVVPTPVEGWSADGKTWLPTQPGNLTPQEKKNEKK